MSGKMKKVERGHCRGSQAERWDTRYECKTAARRARRQAAKVAVSEGRMA